MDENCLALDLAEASGLCNLKRRGELDRLERVVVSRHDMHPASLRMMQELFELVVER